FRVPVESERLQEEAVEMAAKEVGHVEGGEIVLGRAPESLHSLIEGEAMRSFDAFDAMALEQCIEHAAGAAIAVTGKDPLDALGARLGDRLFHGRHDPLRFEMKLRRQADEVEMVETELFANGEDLAGEHAAGNDAHPCRPCARRGVARSRFCPDRFDQSRYPERGQTARASLRRAISALAVSTA